MKERIEIKDDKSQPNEMGCVLLVGTDSDHPSIITDLTDIEATEILVKGEQYFTSFTKKENRKAIPGKVYEYNLWKLETKVFYGHETVFLNHAIENMLDMLDKKEKIFKEIFNKYSNCNLNCYAYYFEVSPYFQLKKEVLPKLASYGINVDFNIYCLAE